MSDLSIPKKATWILGLTSGIMGIMGHVIIWSQQNGSRNFIQKVAYVIRLLM